MSLPERIPICTQSLPSLTADGFVLGIVTAAHISFPQPGAASLQAGFVQYNLQVSTKACTSVIVARRPPWAAAYATESSYVIVPD